MQVWLNLLEMYLKSHVIPAQWSEVAIMLLSHSYVEQIGELAQYTGSMEGFNKLKGTLLRSQKCFGKHFYEEAKGMNRQISMAMRCAH